MFYILSRHFQLEYNGKRITRHSRNLNVLRTLQFRYDLKIEIVYPDYIMVREKPYFSTSTQPTFFQDKKVTSFIASDEFEMEFDFRILPDDRVKSPNRNKFPVLFLESDSMKLTIWLDPGKTLEVVHYNSIPDSRGKQYWHSLLSMDLSPTLNALTDRWFTSTAPFNHLYVQIGNKSIPNKLKLNLNGQIATQQPRRRILQRGETVHVIMFKAAWAVNGVIRNVALYHNR